MEDEEEKRHEASTAAGVRARERRRKAIEERRRRREELGEDGDDSDGPSVRVESDADSYDDEDEEASHSKRAHSVRQAAAIDTANAGLQVVASFLEQVVSAIELEVTDVTLRIQHQPRVGAKQTSLIVKLPWVHFSDLNKEQQEKRDEEERREAEASAAQRATRREAARVQREAERARRAAERIARGQLADTDADADAAAFDDDADAEAEAEAEASIRRAFEARLARARSAAHTVDGPKYEYHKSIRFHGFRVELQEEATIDTSFAQFPPSASTVKAAGEAALTAVINDESLDDSTASHTSTSEPQTIISGSMDQTCIITLKLKMADTAPDQPKLESTCFIQSLRALMTPRQVALLADLAAAIGLSSKQVALNAQMQPSATHAISSPSHAAQTAAYDVTHTPHTRTSHSSHTSPDDRMAYHRTPTSSAADSRAQPTSHSSPTTDTAAAAAAETVVHLWSLETHILHCSLTLTETDEQTWSTDWWLAGASGPTTAPGASSGSSTHSPDAIVQSVIPGIHSNHLFLASHHTFLNIQQTSAEATVKVTLGSVQLEEYLTQIRTETPVRRPSVDHEAAPIEFKARPLISFLPPSTPPAPSALQYPQPASSEFAQSTRPVSLPHLSLEYRSTVDSSRSLEFHETPNRFFEVRENATTNSRVTLACQPAHIDLDLGLGERMTNLIDAVTAPTAYLTAGAAQQSDHSVGNSFTFDLPRPDATAHMSDEIIREMTHPRRQHAGSSRPRSSFAQTVLIAPTIHLNILFPSHTPSQQQPHPYTRMEQLAPNPYTDARGLLRPERLSLELHDVSLANEVDLTAMPTVADPMINPSLMVDSEWKIRFHSADVFLHRPKPTGPSPYLDCATPADLSTIGGVELIRKRIVTTAYPMQQSASAAAAYFSHAAAASYISILTRASIVPGAPFIRATAPHGDSASAGSSSSTAEGMFFDGLPNMKHWESSTLNGERQRVFKTANTSNTSESADSHSTGALDAAIFESLAIANSALVVTIHLPVAALHLAKYDYDLVLFLYNIFGEMMEETPIAPEEVQPLTAEDAHALSSAFVHDVVPDAMHHSTLSAQEEDDHVDLNGLSRSVHYRHGVSSMYASNRFAHGDDDAEEDDEFDPDHAPGSLSRSDSFSSDSSSEMFESVGGADSVILKKVGAMSINGHRGRSALLASGTASTNFSAGANSLLKSTTGESMSGADDAQLALRVKQYFLQRQPMNWAQLKRLVLGVPYGMAGSAHQEQIARSDTSLSAWVCGQTRSLPATWHAHRQRLHDLFGTIPLTPLHTQPIEPEDGGHRPLTMDSSIVHQSDDDDEPHFAPTLSSSRSQSTPRSGSDGSMPHDGVRESNLSDADSDESLPGDSQELEDARSHHDDDRRRVAFGTTSVVFGRGSTAAALLSDASLGEIDDHHEDADDASDGANLNPTDIFARASHTSGQSQLFQPAAMSLSSALPTVEERATAASAYHQPSSSRSRTSSFSGSTYGMQSSIMSVADGAPELFQSFLPAPDSAFDMRASINPDLSVDYSHLPAAVLSPRQPLARGTESKESSLGSKGTYAAPPSSGASSRPPPVRVSTSTTLSRPPPLAASTIAPVASPYKHALSLRLSIQRASLALQDNPPGDSTPTTATSSAAASMPQTFHIDIGEARLFQVTEFERQPVSYIAIRAGDLTLREYRDVVTTDQQLYTKPSLPIIFKTLSERPQGRSERAPSVDAWGRGERESDDDVTSPSPDSHDAHESTSVAWSNPVLLINLVLKVSPHLHLRDTQAVINLRALTLQYSPSSEWIQKLMAFFTPTEFVPPSLPPTFNVTAVAPPTPTVTPTKDLLHLFLHGYDVSIDYNPDGLSSRAVFSIDHVHLQTTVYPDSPVSVLKLEVRDVALFLVPFSSKSSFLPCISLSELSYPFMHRVKTPSLFAHLETIGYARIATMDWLDAVITQNSTPSAATASKSSTAHIPALSVEITNGLLTLLTCWDSFRCFTDLCGHFAASIQDVEQVAEIDVRFENDDPTATSSAAPAEVERRVPASYQITASNALNSETSGGFNARAFSTSHQRSAYLLDDDEEEEAAAAATATVSDASHPTVSVSSSSSRNILDQLDHNAFGADLGVAQVYSHDANFEMKLNDNYHDERYRQTSISLALQEAAERELARARRAELSNGDDAALSMYGLRRANSSSPSSLSTPRPSPAATSDHSARWLSSRESDELVEKDIHATYVASLPDEASRTREEELAREKEERRRRRREEERERGAAGMSMRSHDPKDQRVPPRVIDDHVPLVDEDTRTGRARLKPPADYPNSVSEILLLNLTLCWRMFAGQDWDRTLAPPSEVGQARTQRSSSTDELPEVNNGAMGSAAFMDFYGADVSSSSTNPFAASYATGGPSSTMARGHVMTVPLPAGGFQASQVASDSYTPQMAARDRADAIPASDVIPRGYRQTDRVMEVVLRGASLRSDQFGPGQQIASRLLVAFDDIEVHDLIVTSPFKNFLCYYATGSKGRELGSSMVRLEMTSVRPDPTRVREEYRVKLSVLPLRLNVDQAAVDFFVQFFSQSSQTDPADEARRAQEDREEGIAAVNMWNEDQRDTLAMSPAQAEFRLCLSQFLARGNLLPTSVASPTQARDIVVRLRMANFLTQAQLSSAVEYSDAQVSRWMHDELDDTVGLATVQLLNRLLPAVLADASTREAEEDSESEEDEELSSGIGGVVIGPGGGRSPMRRLSDPVQAFHPFSVPAMPADWIPAGFARQHAHLLPILDEAYHKFYDVLHATVAHSEVNSIAPWRPTRDTLALQSHESVSDYRTRILSCARGAARLYLKSLPSAGVREVENQTYIQSFQVVNKIVLCIDWKPNSFDLRGSHTDTHTHTHASHAYAHARIPCAPSHRSALVSVCLLFFLSSSLQNGDWAQMANLLPLEHMELDLKSVRMTGVSGFGRVGLELAKLWAYDLSRYQAHRYLAGVQPIRSMVNVGSGVADLVLLPVSHYHHHGNLKRGVQRGLSSFLRNVSLESMSAAARLAQGAQTVLEAVDDVLTFAPAPLPKHAQSQFAQQRTRGGRRGVGASSSSSIASDARRRSSHISKQANPPASAQDGFRQAYESLSRGLQSAATQLIVVPRDEYQRYGSKALASAAIKSMPTAVLTPIIGGMEAIAKVLNGVTNSIDPKRIKENRDKFKSNQA